MNKIFFIWIKKFFFKRIYRNIKKLKVKIEKYFLNRKKFFYLRNYSINKKVNFLIWKLNSKKKKNIK